MADLFESSLPLVSHGGVALRRSGPLHATRRALAWALGSLKFRITVGGILALGLGIGLITALLVDRAERDVLRAERDRELSEAVHTAMLLSRRVVRLQRALGVVAAQLDPETLADDKALARFLEDRPVLRSMFTSVFVASPDGQVRMLADEAGLRRPDLNLADRDYFLRTLSEARPLVSEPLTSRVSGMPLIVFTYPVRGADGIYAVLTGALRLANGDLLADLADAHDDELDAQLVVADRAGRVLAHPDQARLMQSLADEPRLAQAFGAWTADGAAVEPAGLELLQAGELVSAAGVAGPDWMVWRARSEARLLAPLRAARQQAWVWAAGLIALLSVSLLGFLWWLLRPLSQLERRAQHLFDGTLHVQSGWPVARGEIGRLGRVLRQVGTERAQLEFFNNEVLRKLGSVMSAAPVGIAFTREQRFELVSAEFCRLFARQEQDLLGQAMQIVFATHDDVPALVRQVEEAFLAGRSYAGEWQMRRVDDTLFWALLRGKPVDPLAPTAGTIWTLNDISDQRIEREQLEWAAGHDSLTGLANRKCFEQRAARVVDARPVSLPAALVFIDLDRFKAINDSLGHAAGDAVLKAVAEAMLSCVRATDLVVRLGGDEFALLLERCHHAVALRIAENVRQAIAAIAIPWEQQRLKVGASLGVATLSAGMPDVAAWLEAADAACYAAKAAGRGVVHVARPAADPTPARVAAVGG